MNIKDKGRGLLIRIWNLFKDEWVKGVVVIFVGLSFLYMSKVIDFFDNKFEEAKVKYKNISKEESLMIARKYIGVNVCDAIPFFDTNTSQQHILVITNHDFHSDDYGNVYLLKGYEEFFEKNNLEMIAYNEMAAKSCGNKKKGLTDYYGVTDIDEDGYKEIFATYYSGGTGSWGVSTKVYDTKTEEIYSIHADGSRSWNVLDPRFDGNVEDKKNLKKWLTQNLKLHVMGANENVSQMHASINDWLMYNGRDFTKGKLASDSYSQNYRSDGWSSTYCDARKGSSIWRVVFKGPIIELKNNSFRMIYVPNDISDSAGTLVVGKQYVWLPIRVRNEILAYDSNSNSIVGFEIKEWERYRDDTHEFWKDSKGYRLSTQDKKLTIFREPVTIVAENLSPSEFVEAILCE